MLRGLLTAAVLGITATAGVLTTGCASDGSSTDEPYALTGESDQASMSASDRRVAATDSKGHYRPDLDR